MAIEIETWAEKLLIENAAKVRRLAEEIEPNKWSGPVQTVKNEDKLTIYTKVVHVARSGMTRWINLYVSDSTGIHELTPANLPHLKEKWDERHQAWKVGGCGMDMGFALVYSIALFYGAVEQNLNGKAKKNLDMGYSIVQRWL